MLLERATCARVLIETQMLVIQEEVAVMASLLHISNPEVLERARRDERRFSRAVGFGIVPWLLPTVTSWVNANYGVRRLRISTPCQRDLDRAFNTAG